MEEKTEEKTEVTEDNKKIKENTCFLKNENEKKLKTEDEVRLKVREHWIKKYNVNESSIKETVPKNEKDFVKDSASEELDSNNITFLIKKIQDILLMALSLLENIVKEIN